MLLDKVVTICSRSWGQSWGQIFVLVSAVGRSIHVDIWPLKFRLV